MINYFISRKLEQSGLKPAGQAEPRDLIRRATFDLIGLPPTPQETEDFLNAYQADPNKAWAKLIDRLLESPRYGEHWARHWLDVTRYADTGGMSNDYERSNMWRYRDYVIRAFNEDKPYNEFIIEQLAGDELADQSVQERTGGPVQVAHQPGLFIRSVRGEYFRGGKCTGWLGSGGWADRPLSPWGLAIVG